MAKETVIYILVILSAINLIFTAAVSGKINHTVWVLEQGTEYKEISELRDEIYWMQTNLSTETWRSK